MARFRHSRHNAVIGALATALVVSTLAAAAVQGWARLAPLAIAVATIIALASLRGHVRHVHATRSEAFAAAMSWSFMYTNREYDARVKEFPLRGNGTIHNIVAGPYRFYAVASFLYEVRFPWPRTYQVTVLELPTLLPSVQVIPADLRERLVIALGGQDVLLGDAAFDREWRVAGADEGVVMAAVTPRVREVLRESGAPLVIDGGVALTWAAGPLALDGVLTRVDGLLEVVTGMPDQLWRRFAANPSAERWRPLGE